MKNRGWTMVCKASGLTQAEIIAGRLRTEGIETRLEYESIGKVYGLTLDGLGEVKVMVPEACAEKARQVLAQDYSEADIPWKGEE